MKFLVMALVAISSMAFAQIPQSRHVWMITEENHSYESVIGNPAMPFFNSLAGQYGLATEYYAEQHNSISALMWLVAGQPITGDNQTTTCYDVDNVARHLMTQKLTWRSYQEDLPHPGFLGLNNLNYVRRHNPLIDFVDTCTPSQAMNSVPLSQLAIDIGNHRTPNYAYITPNLLNDAHDGPLSAADSWLSVYVPELLALPEFQPGGDGLLFIVWDEADLSGNQGLPDNRCSARISTGCGGRLATLVIGPQVRRGYQSRVRYDHANLLRTVCDALALAGCPGAGALANPMSDFFNVVDISTPFPNAMAASPIRVQAQTRNDAPVMAMQIYVDDVLKYQLNSNSLNTQLPLTVGTHHIVVQSWDRAGGIHKNGVYVNVQPQAVIVSSPRPNSVVGPSVTVNATAGGQTPVSKMQLYVDGNAQYQSSGNTVSTSIALAPGTHTLAVQASDSAGNLTTNRFAVTSASPAVQVLSPAPNSSFYAPMAVSAIAVDPTPVVAVQIYVDSALTYEFSGTGIETLLPISSGNHWVVVQEWNQSGATYKKGGAINVVPVPITVVSPGANSSVASPVTVIASAPVDSPVETMQIYVDNALAYQVSGKSVNHSVALPANTISW